MRMDSELDIQRNQIKIYNHELRTKIKDKIQRGDCT